MTGRILRTELRRSSALWAGALFLALTLALLFGLTGPWWKGGGAWNEEWTGLATWQRNMLSYVWPLSLGAGALQGLRDHRSGVAELMDATPRPRWHRVWRTALAMAIGLGGAYVVVFLVGAVQVVGNTSYFSLGWLPIAAVGVLSLIGGAWLGMGIGRLFPSVLTPPLVGVAGLAVVVLSTVAQRPDLAQAGTMTRLTNLSPVLAGARNAFTRVSGSLTLGQALWFLGLAATGFLLLSAKNVRGKLTALVPVLVGVLAGVVLVPTDPAAARPVDEAAVALVCSHDGQRVCVTSVHEDMLAGLAGPARDALRLLKKLPGAPESVEELVSLREGYVSRKPDTGGLPSRPEVLMVNLADSTLGKDPIADPDQLRTYLLAGAGTRSCFAETYGSGPAYVRERAARTVSAGWLAGELKPLPGGPYSRSKVDALAQPAWKALRALPEAEQHDRVAAMRVAAMRCQGDLLDVLAKGPVR